MAVISAESISHLLSFSCDALPPGRVARRRNIGPLSGRIPGASRLAFPRRPSSESSSLFSPSPDAREDTIKPPRSVYFFSSQVLLSSESPPDRHLDDVVKISPSRPLFPTVLTAGTVMWGAGQRVHTFCSLDSLQAGVSQDAGASGYDLCDLLPRKALTKALIPGPSWPRCSVAVSG